MIPFMAVHKVHTLFKFVNPDNFEAESDAILHGLIFISEHTFQVMHLF